MTSATVRVGYPEASAKGKIVRNRILIAVILIGSLWAPTISAQKFEISPFAGLRFGGAMTDETGITYDLDSTASYGVGLEFALSDEARIQLLWSHQSTGVNRFSYDEDDRVDLDIDYFHAGTAYIFDPLSRTRPFLGMSIGATRVASPAANSAATYFSVGIGGGVKLFLNDHIGFRFDGRFFGTFGGSGAYAVGCGAGGCLVGFSGDFLWQGEAAVALVFGF